MWQEAAGVLEDGLKLYPGFITAMVALGRAYDHLGQATKAKAILEEAIKLSPENLRAHRTLIKIYASQGLNESALQSCAVILTVNPRDEEARSVQACSGWTTETKEGTGAVKAGGSGHKNRSLSRMLHRLSRSNPTTSTMEARTEPDRLVFFNRLNERSLLPTSLMEQRNS